MAKVIRLVALALVLMAPVPPLAAATKYNACSKLTAAEVEAALQAKVDRTIEQDVTIDSGQYAGETQSNCTWVIRGGTVGVSIIRAPRTPQEREVGLAKLRGAVDKSKQQGWTIESTDIAGATCIRAVPPAGEKSARPLTMCLMEARGLAFSVTVMGPGNVTAAQVAGLAGRVASRLP